MHRICIALFLLVIVHVINARFIYGKEFRTERPVSVYDRNCLFSPIGCHFVKGRRAMTFINPSEVEEERRNHRTLRHTKPL